MDGWAAGCDTQKPTRDIMPRSTDSQILKVLFYSVPIFIQKHKKSGFMLYVFDGGTTLFEKLKHLFF